MSHSTGLRAYDESHSEQLQSVCPTAHSGSKRIKIRLAIEKIVIYRHRYEMLM